MSIELVLRFIAGVGIVALYISNIGSGLTASRLWRKRLPPVRTRWKSLKVVLVSLFRPCILAEESPKYTRLQLVEVIACYGAYISSFTAFGFAATHAQWMLQGAWIDQPQIFLFAAFHWLGAIFIHAIHILLAYSVDLIGVKKEA